MTYEVWWLPKCERRWKKIAKRADPALRAIVKKEIEGLETNPKAGKKMERDLEGFHSIRIEEFSFRIVYKISGDRVEIYAIGHRKEVYEQAHRLVYGR